jgi:hypothetical protein
MRRVDLFVGVHLERQMLEPDAVVAMRTTVGGTKAEPFVPEAQVDDLLGAPVGRIALFLLQTQRSQEIQVEGERTLDVADRKVDVLNPTTRHPQPASHTETDSNATDLSGGD